MSAALRGTALQQRAGSARTAATAPVQAAAVQTRKLKAKDAPKPPPPPPRKAAAGTVKVGGQRAQGSPLASLQAAAQRRVPARLARLGGTAPLARCRPTCVAVLHTRSGCSWEAPSPSRAPPPRLWVAPRLWAAPRPWAAPGP